jgi:hypothetical protein
MDVFFIHDFPNLLHLHLFKFFIDGFTPFLSRPWIIKIPSFFKGCRFLFNSSYTNERKVCMVKLDFPSLLYPFNNLSSFWIETALQFA